MHPQIITKMSQFDNAFKNLAKHVDERQLMFLDVRVASNRPFGHYWVEGSNAYHLVTFAKLPNGTGKTECGCISQFLCYHQAAAVTIHQKRVAERKEAKQERLQDEMDAAVECRRCEKFAWASDMEDGLCSTCTKIVAAVAAGDYVICPTCEREVPKDDIDAKGLCTRCAVHSYIKKGA